MKTIWSPGEVWFTFLRNVKEVFLIWIWFVIQQHRRFFLRFDFYQLCAPIHLAFFRLPPPIRRRSTTLTQILSPKGNVIPERQGPSLQLQSRTLFYHLPGIFHYLTLLYVYLLQLLLPAPCPLPGTHGTVHLTHCWPSPRPPHPPPHLEGPTGR